ncbi:MAG TPA: transporter [Kofleriaceae bacterium]|nr:transporter [Kofleriaceae bacterium]
MNTEPELSRQAFTQEERLDRWRASALASYAINGKKLGVDITRGDTIQIQGGLGGRVHGVLDLGVAGYALWQMTDDRGSALPPQLVGARDRVFGLGPEVDLAVRALHARLWARFEWDLGGEARPVGTILVAGIAAAVL